MPVVAADDRYILYAGPSEEDAKLVYELAREYEAYRRVLHYLPNGKASGRVYGKIMAVLAAAEVEEKKKAVAEAIKAFREQEKRTNPRDRRWDDEPSPEPPKRVVENLLAASFARDFEAARREWEYNGKIIYEGEPGFSRECGLCGPKELMRMNFVVRNVVNGNTLQVGSVCVKRFLVLAGTSSMTESMDTFNHRTKLAVFGKTQRSRIADLGVEKVPEKSLVGLLGAIEKVFPKDLSPQDTEIILNAAGIRGRAAEVFTALVKKDVSVVRSLKLEKMIDRDKKRKKLAAVFTTLSRSSAYRNPARVG